jgi:hypothetical protein
VIALVATAILAALIVVGSRRLSHFDAALVGYTFATLFAAFAVSYRYAMWVQRPPTALYWKRGWEIFFRPQQFLRNLRLLGRRLLSVFVFNRFIWRRDRARGAAHWLLMWGCILAAAITFPLVFGWVHFETMPGDFDTYRVFVFGFPTFSFPIDSLTGHVLFHGLVWASYLVIAGVMIAMHRRMRDRDALVLQQFGEDFVPLILLFSVSMTGLMLVVSYQWMYGYGYDFLSLLHAVTVIVTLLWLPFGKFFHIFQRPAQIGVAFYRDLGKHSPQAHCARCGEAFASEMHVTDLIQVERELGFDYETPEKKAEHYQWICPRCRRLLPAIAQGRLWQQSQAESEKAAGAGEITI